MAQLGSALDWGSRGRGFKSRQPDEKPQGFLLAVFVVRLLLPGVFAARTSVPGDCRVLICNRNVMRISPLLFLPVKRSFLGNNTAFVQVVHGGCIVSGGHNRFNDCSKLFHRSKSSTGMISTCLLLASGQMTHPFLWLLASRALVRFSTVSTRAASCLHNDIPASSMKNEAGERAHSRIVFYCAGVSSVLSGSTAKSSSVGFAVSGFSNSVTIVTSLMAGSDTVIAVVFPV